MGEKCFCCDAFLGIRKHQQCLKLPSSALTCGCTTAKILVADESMHSKRPVGRTQITSPQIFSNCELIEMGVEGANDSDSQILLGAWY